MAKERIFVGLASGWVADGVDAAMVSVTGRGDRMKVRQLHANSFAYAPELSKRIRTAAEGQPIRPADLAELDRDIATAFANAAIAVIDESKTDRQQIVAIGSSGQPIARTEGGLVELGNPAVIAAKTNLPVSACFAASDVAAGGLGGPVRAWPDWRLFRDGRLSRVVIHLGGIVSISVVPAASVATDVIAFDASPGSVLLDALAAEHCDKPCDTDGGIAASGRVNLEMLHELLSHPYFCAAPPKRTAPDKWGATYQHRLATMADKYRVTAPADVIATVTEMIARAVADAIGRQTERPHEVVLAGGGARNIHLAQRIRMRMSPSSTYPVERYGFDTSAYSSACVAMLAAARIDGKAAHCPPATGAAQATILGGLWI